MAEGGYRPRRALPPDPASPETPDDDFETRPSAPPPAAPRARRAAPDALLPPDPSGPGRSHGPDPSGPDPAVGRFASIGDPSAVTPPHPGRTAAMPLSYQARRSAGSTASPASDESRADAAPENEARPDERQARHSATTVLPTTRARRAAGSARTPVDPSGAHRPTPAAPSPRPSTGPGVAGTSFPAPEPVHVTSPDTAELMGLHGVSPAGAAPEPARGRRRRGVVLGGIAAGAVVLAGVVFLVVTLLMPGGVAALPSGPPSSGGSGSPGSTSAAPPELTTDMMLTAALAEQVTGQGWRIASDTTGQQEPRVNATCLRDVVDQPPAISERTRTLVAGSASSAPAVLHQALLYGSPEQAADAFSARAAALGACMTKNAQVGSAATAPDLGDDAVGVVVTLQDTPATTHTVWIGRTGTVVDIVDLALTSGSVSLTKAAPLLAAVTTAQCTTVGGTCSNGYTVKAAPPPASGGDDQGLLVLADLPPVKGSSLHWALGEIGTSAENLRGTQCEGMDLGKVPGAEAVLTRSYLLADDPDNIGIDMVVYTMKSKSAAKKAAATMSDNIGSCQQLTATVSGEKTYKAPKGSPAFSGTSYVVVQQLTDGKTSYRYRVSVAAVGDKLVYVFSNVTKDKDFTSETWSQLAIRAAQRAAQAD